MINNQNLAVLSEKVARLESAVSNSTSASGISYDNTDSGLTADDVQGAIDELAPALTAEGTSYDNTESGLTATDTQAAIDEIKNLIGTTVPIKIMSIPNVGQHKSIELTLGDSDVFALVCVVGGIGSKAVYLISNGTGAGVLIENDYSATKNSDTVFTITSSGNWSRAIILAFAPIDNPITYRILD